MIARLVLKHSVYTGIPLITENHFALDLEVLQREGKIDKDMDCPRVAYLLMGMAEYAHGSCITAITKGAIYFHPFRI